MRCASYPQRLKDGCDMKLIGYFWSIKAGAWAGAITLVLTAHIGAAILGFLLATWGFMAFTDWLTDK